MSQGHRPFVRHHCRPDCSSLRRRALRAQGLAGVASALSQDRNMVHGPSPFTHHFPPLWKGPLGTPKGTTVHSSGSYYTHGSFFFFFSFFSSFCPSFFFFFFSRENGTRRQTPPPYLLFSSFSCSGIISLVLLCLVTVSLPHSPALLSVAAWNCARHTNCDTLTTQVWGPQFEPQNPHIVWASTVGHICNSSMDGRNGWASWGWLANQPVWQVLGPGVGVGNLLTKWRWKTHEADFWPLLTCARAHTHMCIHMHLHQIYTHSYSYTI